MKNKQILQWIKQNKIILLLIFCLLFLFLTFKQCSQKKYYKYLFEQNQFYYTDTIKQLKNKVGEIEYERTLLISDKKTLKEINEKLYNELIKEQGKVIALTNAVVEIKTKIIQLHDSIYLIDTSKNIYRTQFEKNEYYTTDKLNYLYIKGYSDLQIGFNNKPYIISKGTFLTQNEFGIHLKVGYKEINNKLKVFITSDHPYFSITSLDAVMIEDKLNSSIPFRKNKKIGIGPNISFGIDDNFQTRLIIGVGIQYNLFKF